MKEGLYSVALALYFVAGAVFADIPATVGSAEGTMTEEVSGRLANFNIVRGRFVQQRDVEGLTAPLNSAGRFLFWRGQGIYWSTESPLQQTLTYRQDKTLQWGLEGEAPRELHGRGDAHFRRILLDIFSFNPKQLAQQFEISWQVQGESWQMDLQPRKRSVKRVLRKVTLNGSGYVDQLTMTDANGLALRIQFSDVETPTELDAAQCTALFAYSTAECEARITAVSP